MLKNRIKQFIRNIIQNSRLNREKFVNNKKRFNMISVKNRNHNLIIKRNLSYMPSSNKNPNENPYTNIFMVIIFSLFMVTNKEFKK
jgi:hypothetical protein